MKGARTMKVALISGAIIFGTAGAAFAGHENVGGGIWDYGADTTIWSDYYHPSVCHGSSVEDGYGNITRSGNTAAGYTSYASRKASFNGNKAYWRNSGC